MIGRILSELCVAVLFVLLVVFGSIVGVMVFSMFQEVTK